VKGFYLRATQRRLYADEKSWVRRTKRGEEKECER